mgnify:CR=1 FL=1
MGWDGPQGKPPGRAVLGAARGRPYGAAKPRRPCGPYACGLQRTAERRGPKNKRVESKK